MAWDGYFRYGDVEILNVTRTLAYARSLNMPWVKDVNEAPGINALLNEAPYTTPADGAPWLDAGNPDSYEFAGLIPLSVTGLEDSTREATAFEFTTDGGSPGRIRHATKSVVFSVALVGASEAAVEYGFGWLKRALLTPNCVPTAYTTCRYPSLFFSRVKPTNLTADAPALDLDGGDSGDDEFDEDLDGGASGSEYDTEFDGGDAMTTFVASDEWVRVYEQHVRNVGITRGPQITAKRSVGCDGKVWVVTFTALVGDPFIYGSLTQVLDGLGDAVDPYVGGLEGNTGSNTYTYSTCPAPVYTPVYDPSCIALVTPPAPPSLAIGCYTPPAGTWNRTYAEIPSSVIPEFDETRPIIRLTAGAEDIRGVRIQFFGGSVTPIDDCGWVGQFYVTYIPAEATLTIDTIRETAYIVDSEGYARGADSLILTDVSVPPVYFGLSCGAAYSVTLDTPSTFEGSVSLSLDIVPRSA